MAETYNKKEREKKKRKKKQEKMERKLQKKHETTKSAEFVYVDENGFLSDTPPDPLKKKKVSLESIHISTPKKLESDQVDFSRQGMVKFFNTEKGYGFIVDNDTDESFFVHIENIQEPIKDRDRVTFEVGKGPKGPVALAVRLTKAKPKVVPPPAPEAGAEGEANPTAEGAEAKAEPEVKSESDAAPDAETKAED